MNVQEYVKEDGSNPYQTWLDSLNSMAAVKVTIARSRLEVGNTSNIKWFDGIGEYRIDWGPGYRIYLVQDGQDLIVLFGGRNQEAPAGRYCSSLTATPGVQRAETEDAT